MGSIFMLMGDFLLIEIGSTRSCVLQSSNRLSFLRSTFIPNASYHSRLGWFDTRDASIVFIQYFAAHHDRL